MASQFFGEANALSERSESKGYWFPHGRQRVGRGLLYPFAQETTVRGVVVFAHANSVATAGAFAKG